MSGGCIRCYTRTNDFSAKNEMECLHSRPKKMKVICAGLSKTGTKSLAKALRILGFTVFDYPEHRDFHMNEWLDVYCKGKSPDLTQCTKMWTL